MAVQENPLILTLLGTGHSTGIPQPGNVWGACDPANPRNKRRRASLLAQKGDTSLVVDTGPDFRLQSCAVALKRIDAILYTHSHSDHITGIDDVRVYAFRQDTVLPIYGIAETLNEIGSRFNHLFSPDHPEIYRGVLEKRTIDPSALGTEHEIHGLRFIPFLQDHYVCESLGFRFGPFAYSTDLSELDEAALKTLEGIDTWVVDGANVGKRGRHVHANLDTLKTWAERIRPRKMYLTHLQFGQDYEALREMLPRGMEPAWDGLQFQIQPDGSITENSIDLYADRL